MKRFLIVGLLMGLVFSVGVVSASTVPVSENILLQQDTQTAIIELVEDMEAAVLEGDADTYLSYVDLSDANFAVEHTNWVKDWADEEHVTEFSLDVTDIEVDDDTARGTLKLSWQSNLDHQPGGEAIFVVQFTYDTEADRWLYAGEYWNTTETEHFLIHVAPGLEDIPDFLKPLLPDIYDDVTQRYGHIPETKMEIKLYRSWEPLVATTLLSLPQIAGWNEPAESLKLVGNNPQNLERIIAHEFTHFLTFDQAGQTLGESPWWVLEGVAENIAAPYAPNGIRTYDARYIQLVRDWAANGQLADWDDIAVFEETPVELWRFTYPQGYTFVRFVTDVYGEETRNAWIAAMSDMPLEEATQSHLNMTFDDLDAEFRLWLAEFTLE